MVLAGTTIAGCVGCVSGTTHPTPLGCVAGDGHSVPGFLLRTRNRHSVRFTHCGRSISPQELCSALVALEVPIPREAVRDYTVGARKDGQLYSLSQQLTSGGYLTSGDYMYSRGYSFLNPRGSLYELH